MIGNCAEQGTVAVSCVKIGLAYKIRGSGAEREYFGQNRTRSQKRGERGGAAGQRPKKD